MLTVVARQFHASQDLIRLRAARNPNQLIEEKETFGERIADGVASFGGSWTFIITFGVTLALYTTLSIVLVAPAAIPGTPTPSSCSTSSSPCSPPSRHRSS